MTARSDDPMLAAADLELCYGGRGPWALARRRRPAPPAVDKVNLAIGRGETVGIVGESGSGKSSLGRLLIGALRPSRGSVRFWGEDINAAPTRRWRQLRADLQLVFQNAGASFNPRRTIGEHLQESIALCRRAGDEGRLSPAAALAMVGLPRDALDKFAFQLSGGQQQRAAIARAVISGPQFVVCDEIVSALDLSVQAQILNLLQELRRERQLSYLFISHDLDVVRVLSDRIAVMYRGRIVEQGAREAVYARPRHPYTRLLMSAALRTQGALRAAAPDAGAVQAVLPTPGDGCAFAERCAVAGDRCRRSVPALSGTADHMVACFAEPTGGTDGRPRP